VVGQVVNGQMLFDPQALAALKAGTLTATSNVVQSTSGEDFNVGQNSSGTRDQSIDGLIEQLGVKTGNRVVSPPNGADAPLDEKHLATAENEINIGPLKDPVTGEIVTSPKDGKPFDHVGEVLQAEKDLQTDIDTLLKKLQHGSDYINPLPDGSIEDGFKLLDKMQALLNYAKSRVPPGSSMK